MSATRRRHNVRRGAVGLTGLLLAPSFLLLSPFANASHELSPPSNLRIALAQIGVSDELRENLEKVLHYVEQAARQRARVVVFPEGTLRPLPPRTDPESEAVYSKLKDAANDYGIYIIFGAYRTSPASRGQNLMAVLNPEGEEIFHYTKLYDDNAGPIPGTFRIDGISASAVICSDRWLRAVAELPVMEGAQIVFELSGNFRKEWVEPLGWFWYVPWALRNQVFVAFANTAYTTEGPGSGHGHSAVIGPDGEVLAALPDDRESLLIVDIDPRQATRQEALRRYTHPVLGLYWQAGREISRREHRSPPKWPSESSPGAAIRVSAAQIAVSASLEANLERMRAAVVEAADQGSDVVVFPELALSGWEEAGIGRLSFAALTKAHEQLEQLARGHRIWLVYGAPKPLPGSGSGPGWANAAYVVDDRGRRVTEYEQMVVERPHLFRAGRCPERMHFQIKGIRAVVTLGREILWNELAELAAFGGAQVQFHLAYTRPEQRWSELTWQQVQMCYASFFTFSTIVNAASVSEPPAIGGTAIWDDLRGREEIRAALGRASLPPAGEPVELFTHWGANRVRHLSGAPGIIHAKRTVNNRNPLPYPRYNRRMVPWYELGARIIRQCRSE